MDTDKEKSTSQPQGVDRSSIEQAKKQLYSTSNDQSIFDRSQGLRFSPRNIDTEDTQNTASWPASTLPHNQKSQYRGGTRFFKILFSISILFCVGAAATAGYIFWSGWNRISSDNLDVSILAPVSISGGETLSFSVNIANNNRADLLDTHITVEYPTGTRDITGISLPRDQRVIDTIPAGSQKETNFQAVLFGEENVTETITATIEYKVPGSDTVYKKEKSFSILLTKAPISLVVDYPKQTNADQDMTLTITAISNSRAPLSNILLKVLYPVGFTLTSTNPASDQGASATWQLGNFDPGQQKVVTIKGVIHGQDSEDKVFRISVGTPRATDEQIIDTTYSNVIATVHLDKPFISARLDIQSLTVLGSILKGVLTFTNNLSRDLIDATIEVVPQGVYYDRYSVTAQNGFYKSTENTLFWDKHTISELASIAPGDSREVNFTLNTFTPEQLKQLTRNPQMSIGAVIRANTLNENGSTDSVVAKTNQDIKFTTNTKLIGRTLYSAGPFRNSGPIPPRAEQKTTYTIQFDVSNTSNQVSDGLLTAVLPIYVQWVGISSPSSEKISYDPNKRTITWRVGETPAYAGVQGPTRSVDFQVELFPSVSQINSIPKLVTDVHFTGVDRFTGSVIKLDSLGQDTSLSDNASSIPTVQQ